MTKEFIPYEQALALKELGFDEPCFGYYHVCDGYTKGYAFCYFNEPERYESDSAVLAPTFSQAFRWFRDKYRLFCEIKIDRTTEPKFCFNIFQYEHFGNYEEIRVGEWYLYRTQEEAELESLKKLIKIAKKEIR